MAAATHPEAYPPPAGEARQPVAPVPVQTLRHWAETVAFAIDNPDAAIDALLELAEGIEDRLAST